MSVAMSYKTLWYSEKGYPNFRIQVQDIMLGGHFVLGAEVTVHWK